MTPCSTCCCLSFHHICNPEQKLGTGLVKQVYCIHLSLSQHIFSFKLAAIRKKHEIITMLNLSRSTVTGFCPIITPLIFTQASACSSCCRITSINLDFSVNNRAVAPKITSPSGTDFWVNKPFPSQLGINIKPFFSRSWSKSAGIFWASCCGTLSTWKVFRRKTKKNALKRSSDYKGIFRNTVLKKHWTWRTSQSRNTGPRVVRIHFNIEPFAQFLFICIAADGDEAHIALRNPFGSGVGGRQRFQFEMRPVLHGYILAMEETVALHPVLQPIDFLSFRKTTNYTPRRLMEKQTTGTVFGA